MVQITGGQFAAIPILNQLVPKEGPKGITLELDFTVADSYSIDLLEEIQKEIIWGAQGVYFDNKANNADVTLDVSTTPQSMVFIAGKQGYRPVLFPHVPKGTFSCTGGIGIFKVTLLNVPMPLGEWG